MNDTQGVPGASLIPDSTDIFTIGVFVLIALFAIGAIAIIVIGARRKRRRIAAEEVVQERIEQEAVAPPPPSPPAPQSVATREPAQPSAEPVVDGAPIAGEPIAAAAAAGEANLAAEAASVPSGEDPASGPITQLKGLGPKVAGRLTELGITRVGDLAALTDADAARLDAQLGPFAGRMARDRWLEQARLLAAGDRAGFEAVFGKL